jgi:hypothetical protein
MGRYKMDPKELRSAIKEMLEADQELVDRLPEPNKYVCEMVRKMAKDINEKKTK